MLERDKFLQPTTPIQPHSNILIKNNRKIRHAKWTKKEDEILRKLVEMCPSFNWVWISSKFINRNPRQCQERWNYYLSPDVNNSPWTKEEDELLLEKYKKMGSQWKKIAAFFNNRTNTNVKNRWISIQRENERKLKCETMKIIFSPLSEPQTLTEIPVMSEPEFYDIFDYQFEDPSDFSF